MRQPARLRDHPEPDQRLSGPPRLSPRAVSHHLRLEPPAVARLVRTLRQAVLNAVPGAAEAIKFGVLCYYHADAYFGALGGNICMIEIKDALRRPVKGRGRRERRPGRTAEQARAVFLSFIHGAALPDPNRLLRGRLKNKRFVAIPDVATAESSAIRALVRASHDLRPWDERLERGS